jgi:hypothetical protein
MEGITVEILVRCRLAVHLPDDLAATVRSA